MSIITDSGNVDRLLSALSEQLAASGDSYELVVVGLPTGFLERLEPRVYGSALTVQFASRLDQIHFKLYALADQGPGKHEADLRALAPTSAELLQAAGWARTHDPSEGFEQALREALAHLGVEDVDLGA